MVGRPCVSCPKLLPVTVLVVLTVCPFVPLMTIAVLIDCAVLGAPKATPLRIKLRTPDAKNGRCWDFAVVIGGVRQRQLLSKPDTPRLIASGVPSSSKPDPRLVNLVRLLARQAARDFVQAELDKQDRLPE